MEVTLVAHEGLAPPSDTFVSLRIGQVQRHARFANTRVYRFPEEKLDLKACGRVEVFKRLGATTVCLGSSLGAMQDIEVPCNDPDFQKLSMRVTTTECGDQTPSKVQKKSEKRVNSARRYLADHQLEDVLKEAMKEVMSSKPTDPHDFIAQYILKHPSRRVGLPPLKDSRMKKEDSMLLPSSPNARKQLYPDTMETNNKAMPPAAPPKPRNLPPIQQSLLQSKSTPALQTPAFEMKAPVPEKSAPVESAPVEVAQVETPPVETAPVKVAAQAVRVTQPTEAATVVKFAFQNLDYDKVMRSSTLKESLEGQTQETIANSVGVPPSSVAVELSKGSVMVNALIYSPHSDAADMVKKQIEAKGETLVQQIDESVAQIPQINDLVADGKAGLGVGGLQISSSLPAPKEATPEPIAQSTAEPAEDTPEPIAQPTAEPAVEPAAEPAAEPVQDEAPVKWNQVASVGTWLAIAPIPKPGPTAETAAAETAAAETAEEESLPEAEPIVYRHWQLRPSIGTWCCPAPPPVEEIEPVYRSFMHRPSVATWCAVISHTPPEPEVITRSTNNLIKRQSTVKFRVPPLAETMAMTTLLQGRLEEIEDLERQHAAAVSELEAEPSQEGEELVAVIESCLEAARAEYSSLQQWGAKRGLSATSPIG